MQDRADIEKLFLTAVEYEQVGDVYHAVKLYKKLIREVPDMSGPYRRLANMYKRRQEWKPCLYYAHCAAELDPGNSSVWRTLGIAAAARADWLLARQAWNKLDYQFREVNTEPDLDLGPLAVCLNPGVKPEVVWAQRIDPARVRIISVPQPSSGLRCQDILLVDHEPMAHRIQEKRRIPIFPALELMKKSNWKTFSIVLPFANLEQIDILAKLCGEAAIGFDNWSLSSREWWGNTEFFGQSFSDRKTKHYLVALSAKRKASVRKVLRNWNIITLQPLGKLQKH